MELWKRNFAFVWANNFITAIGMMAFLPLFPLYLREMGITDSGEIRLWSGVLVGAAPLTAALMGPVWGSLGDRMGRKLMLLRANLSIVLFVGLMGLARSPTDLLLLRLAQGVFSGFIAPSLALVSVATPEDRQGRVMGLLHTALLAGGVAGPLIGGFVADAVGMRMVFPITASLSLVAAISTSLFVREPALVTRRHEVRFTPVSLFQTAFRDLLGFLKEGPWRAILLTVFAVRFGVALIDPILALYVETLDGYDPAMLATTTGIVFGLTTVATLVLTPVWGSIGDRQGARRLLLFCATGASLSYLPQAFVTDVWSLAALRLISGAFVAGIFPAAYTMTAKHSRPDQRGSAYGFTFSSLVLANALGPATGGALAAVIGLRALIVCAAVLMALAALRLVLLRRSGRFGDEPQDEPRDEPTDGCLPEGRVV